MHHPSGEVTLREVLPADLAVFFENRCDPTACRMVGFGPEGPAEFAAKWATILADDGTVKRTVLFDGRVAGNVLCFVAPWSGLREVGYWLGSEFWGKGVATRAVGELLRLVPERPLFARTTEDNCASIRVLEKCGFAPTGGVRVPTAGGGGEVEEVLFELRADPAAAILAETQQLRGTWRQIAWEQDGVPQPPDAPGRETRATFADNTFTVSLADGTIIIEGTYTLDPTRAPKSVDWTDTFGAEAGKTFPAIYTLDGDDFVFCAADHGGERPTEFRSGPGQVLRRNRREE